MRRLWVLVLLVTVVLASCGGGEEQPLATPTLGATPTAEVSLPLRPDGPALYVVNADGTGLRTLYDAGSFFNFSVSPDGGRLALMSAQGGDVVVHAMNVDGGDRKEIARILGFASPVLASPVLWSPDGARLAFTLQHTSTEGPADPPTTYVYSVENGELTEVFSGDAYLRAWAPDSGAIFISQGYQPTVIKRVDLATLQATDVLSGVDSTGFVLSPDGQQVALGSFLGGGTGSAATYVIELARPDGSERRELVRLESAFGISSLAWSPDGQRLAYANATVGEGGISSGVFTVDVATGATTRVTQAPEGVDMQADWSADGTRLLVLRRVCTQCDGPGSKVVLAAADGSGEVPLAGMEEFVDTGFDWSPDGTRFVYGGDKLYAADASGEDARAIVGIPGSNYGPVVWAGGERILFVRRPALPTTAYAVQPNGSDLEVLGVGALAVAPDGQTVAGYDAEGFFIRIGDGEPVRLSSALLEQVGLSGPSGPSFFVWSPDSERVAIGQHQKGGLGLLVASRDTEARLLTSAAWEGDLRWSPDGRRLAYWSDGAIWLVDAEGGVPQQLVSAASQPGFDWSPDGSRLAFVVGTDVRVVVTDGSSTAAQFLFAVSLQQYSGNTLRWSPDGGHIAVSNGRDLAIGEIETPQVTQLPPQLEIFGLEWSQNGDALIFGARPTDQPNQLGVYIVDASGGAPRLLVESSGRRYEVVGRLADGRIVFVSQWTL